MVRAIIVCMLAALTLNVIVTLAIANVMHSVSAPRLVRSRDYACAAPALPLWWEAQRRGDAPQATEHFARIARSATCEVVAGYDSERSQWRMLQTVEAGWPARALRGERWLWSSARPGPDTLDVAPFQRRVFPWRPMRGLLINTIVYAMPMFGVLLLGRVVTSIRAWAREIQARREQCCPQCLYDIRGDFDHGCPECGWNRQ